MKEVVFQGALDPHTPIGQGWLRASHRKLDKKLTLPFRPYHTHDEKQPLKPGQVYELDIEIVPTSIVVPKGYRVGLSVRGRDYVYPGGSGGKLSNMKNEFTGCGPFRRPTRPACRDLWRQDHNPYRRRARGISCCCRSFPISRKRSRRRRRRARRPDAPRRLPSRLAAAERRYSPSRAIIGAA